MKCSTATTGPRRAKRRSIRCLTSLRESRLARFHAEQWRGLHPAIVQSWENSWQEFVPFLEFPVKLSKRELTLHCSPMATEVPQRQLRNDTASLLRRVEAGERLRITVHGHPVAELVPVDRTNPFVPFDELVSELRGTMLPDDHLDKELRELDEIPRDPFE
jgi:prevent-host-death family protein